MIIFISLTETRLYATYLKITDKKVESTGVEVFSTFDKLGNAQIEPVFTFIYNPSAKFYIHEDAREMLAKHCLETNRVNIFETATYLEHALESAMDAIQRIIFPETPNYLIFSTLAPSYSGDMNIHIYNVFKNAPPVKLKGYNNKAMYQLLLNTKARITIDSFSRVAYEKTFKYLELPNPFETANVDCFEVDDNFDHIGNLNKYLKNAL